jgi:Restriction endonuclease
VNSGTWYEKFVQEVYQLLVDQDRVQNIQVEHDVTIKGRSGATHQIDVFWEFQIADTSYRTCLECKAYNSPVKKLHIAAFAGVLADLGNANGVFVTTQGYQKGAKQLAQHQNIRLIVLNPTIRKIVMEMHLTMPECELRAINFDVVACKPLLDAAGLESFNFPIRGTGDSIILLDEQGSREASINEFIRAQPTTAGIHTVPARGYYLASAIGLLPLADIVYEMQLHELREEFSVESKDTVRAVLDDVLQNTTSYVKATSTKNSAHQLTP